MQVKSNDENLFPTEPFKQSLPGRGASGLKNWFWKFFPNLRDAAIRWSEDDASSLAAAVAYYLALSLFPMLLLLTSAFGLVLQFTKIGQDSQNQLLETVAKHGSPVIEKQVSQVLEQLKSQSAVGGPTGVVMAILASIAVFAQLDRGFDRVWRIQTAKGKTLKTTILGVLRHRLLAFSMLLCLGGMLVGLFVAGVIFAQVRAFAGNNIPSLSIVFNWLQLGFVISANALLFGMVYKWLPKKKVDWGDALRGGLLVAVIWELGRVILGFFLIGMRYTSAYGVIGSFIAILLWCYYGMSIIFFGAEYVQVLQRKRVSENNVLVPSQEPISSESLANETSSDYNESPKPEDLIPPTENGYLRNTPVQHSSTTRVTPTRVRSTR